VVVIGLGVCAAILVVIVHRSVWLGAVALATVVGVSTWLAVIDFRVHRLPNRIVGPLAVAVTVGLFVAGFAEDDFARTGRAIGFGVGTAVVLLVLNIVGGLGMGDVKYGYPMAATVGWFGWDALFVALLVTTLAGAAVAVAILIRGGGRNQHLAYGPYMALGLAVSLITCC
jgi:leader peptidase (prepilin peptidase)/N-methyltransferase